MTDRSPRRGEDEILSIRVPRRMKRQLRVLARKNRTTLSAYVRRHLSTLLSRTRSTR